MPGPRRDKEEGLPEFYVRPIVKGQQIAPQVEAALREIWPWLWRHVGRRLRSADQAADLADEVARRVSQFYCAHPGQVHSFLALCHTAAVNLVSSARSKEGRIEYRGLAQDFEPRPQQLEPAWQEKVETAILAEQVANQLSGEARVM